MPARPLGQLIDVDPREVWENEEKDFTPWVAENVDRLTEAIGIQFTVEQTEKRVGSYELDIFGRVDGSDAPVIIENQLGTTDHKHLGQLLTYAAGLDAAVVIWIAANVTDEHRAAIDWLNKSTIDGVSFFLVRPEVVQIDNSKPAVKFVLEASPSEFKRELRNAVGQDERPSHQFRRKFWGDLLVYLESKGHKWAQGRHASTEPWISSPIGKASARVNVSMAMKSRMRVEIYCNDKDKGVFEALQDHKDEIESLFPDETVSWERLEDAIASRVAVYRPYDRDLVSDDSPDRRDLFAWIEKNMSRFREVARKYLT